MNMNDRKTTARALIVDDEPSVCEMLTDKLSEEGYDCRFCTSAAEGLEWLHREPFDAILSDLKMPRMNGIEFLEVARAERPSTAFLLLTSERDVKIAIEAMKHGAADYVVKPFQLDTVLRSLAHALEKKRLEIELEKYRQHLEEMVEQRTMQLKKALQEVEKTYDQTLEALGAALDLRDGSTAGHCARVTRYSQILARAMGCSPCLLRELARGAYLHDIGKIGIPDAILLKEDPLTTDEREAMKTHSAVGYELVKRIGFLAHSAEIVLTHQERYDGRGYPLGLQGENVPLGSRIFSVADTLDAMTTDRPYRKALPLHSAVDEIRRESGRQFDPEVVKAFLAIPETYWLEAQKAAVN